ncbi:protein Z-dependent protease inhibitor-like protein [Dinothrombium tinctorium]|uniref:Protein Z-dependent protease inhibitor-like protein n=1 Tax=Dinothrombium tinctorium TaxID=1965070 RepID=A0A3S3QGF5_9ACAR|nr:protein Z-dependent protease inhibitor-like protein [Dinothrombium tinctorium]
MAYSSSTFPLLSKPLIEEEVIDVAAPLRLEIKTKLGGGAEIFKNFTFRLLNSLLVNEKNFVFCPLTTLTSTACLIAASEGQTRYELTTALFDIDLQSNDEEYALIKLIRKCFKSAVHDKEGWMKAPSFLYVSERYPPLKKFKALANKYFGVSVIKTEFDQKAVIAMNERIRKESDDCIDAVIKQVGDGINMLLIDTTFFCGLWKYGFYQIKPSIFTNFNDTRSEIDFLQGFGKFRMGFNEKFQCHVIELPYNSEDTRMIILLPQQVFEVSENGFRISAPDDLVDSITENTMDMFRCNRPFMFFVVTDVGGKDMIVFHGVVKLL